MENKINEFINFLIEKNCSEKTLRNYRSDLEQYAEQMGITSISEISRANIREFIASMRENTQPSTRNRKLTALRSFCKFLCAEDYLDRNPSIGVSYAKLDKKLPEVMTVNTVSQIIDSVDDHPRNRAAMETLYGTGCRNEELVGIKLEDIDFSNSTVKLFGKGNKERIVPISVSALVAIIDYLDSRKEKSAYLFPNPKTGKPLTTKAMYNIVRKYGKANSTTTSPHKFRHSIATHLLANGMDIRKIQEFLGHENINTTTIYAQVAIEQMAKEFHSAHPRG